MSHYLSDIAARSITNDNLSLIPSTPVPEVIDKESAPDNFQQPEFVQQSIDPVQSNEKQFIEPAVEINRMDAPLPGTHVERSYISKHLERVEADQETSPAKDQPHETVSFKTVEISKINEAGSLDVKSKVNEPAFIDKTVSKIIPEKKVTKKQTVEKTKNKPHIEKTGDKPHEPVQVHVHANTDEIIRVQKQIINPSVKDADQEKNNLQPTSSHTERIIPNKPDLENKRPVQQNKTNQPTPKLVIGKIVVEILPPIVPVTPKVITRVVPSSSKTGHHKSNKLIFGLGQL